MCRVFPACLHGGAHDHPGPSSAPRMFLLPALWAEAQVSHKTMPAVVGSVVALAMTSRKGQVTLERALPQYDPPDWLFPLFLFKVSSIHKK